MEKNITQKPRMIFRLDSSVKKSEEVEACADETKKKLHVAAYWSGFPAEAMSRHPVMQPRLITIIDCCRKMRIIFFQGFMRMKEYRVPALKKEKPSTK